MKPTSGAINSFEVTPLIGATTFFATQNGSRYLQQLCKHFSHKIEVTYDERHGECRLPCGVAVLDAEADALQIRVTAPDPEQLEQTKQVVESHLLRFAFREPPGPLAWQALEPEADEASRG